MSKTVSQQQILIELMSKRDEMKDIHENYGEEEFARGYIVALEDMISIVENLKENKQ